MRRPSPSLLVALLALFVAVGGTATAATVLIKSSKQVRNGALTGADLRNGSVGLGKLSAATRAAMGGTTAVEAYRHAGPAGVPQGGSQRVATLAVPEAGTYAIFGKTVLTAEKSNAKLFNTGESIGGHCVLDAAGDTDESRALLGAPGANSPGELGMQITRGLNAGDEITITCDVVDAVWGASSTSIIAMRLSSAERRAVEG